jgi:hypothetical protein
MQDKETRGHRGDPEGELRSATTDAAILLRPTLAVGVKIAHDHLTNRPPKEEPKQIVLPPGVDKEGKS